MFVKETGKPCSGFTQPAGPKESHKGHIGATHGIDSLGEAQEAVWVECHVVAASLGSEKQNSLSLAFTSTSVGNVNPPGISE